METNPDNKLAIYQSADGALQLDVKLENETVWLNQQQMAYLFDKDRTVIGRHIRNAIREGEIDPEVVSAKFAHTTPHGAIKGSIGNIYQTAFGEEVYPTLEEKAANLLYFVTKNHSFSDGNKRIAAAIFLYFLDRNHALYTTDGQKRIADHTLVALTIMIAESRPDEKEMMVSIIMNAIA